MVNNLSSVPKISKNMKNSACCNTLIYSLQRTAALHLIDLWTVALLSLDMNLTWNVSVFHSSCTFMIFSQQGDREGSKSQKIHVRSWESSSWIGVLFMELSTPSCAAGNKSKLSLLGSHLPNSLKPGSTRSLLAPMLKPCTPSWHKCTPAGVW